MRLSDTPAAAYMAEQPQYPNTGVPGATPMMCLGASAKSAKLRCPPTHTANKLKATQPAADYHNEMHC